MNPVLKRLGRPNISRGDIATMLEKHIGSEPSERHCEEALTALSRIKNVNLSNPLRVLARLVKANGTSCEAVRQAIEFLREKSQA